MTRTRSSSTAADGDGGPRRLRIARANEWRAWAVTAGLWSLVAVGALGGVVGLMRPPVAAQAVEEPDADVAPILPPEIMGVGEWAVRVAVPAVDTPTAGMVIAAPADRPRVAGGVVRVMSATAVAADQLAEDYWAVTVAAEVELAPGDIVRWYFEVGVISSPSGAYAATEPALVPAPSSSESRIEAEGTLRAPDLSDPPVETVASFLEALLSGDAAVGRWTAPGIDIDPAVAPGTFAEVRVARASTHEVDPRTRRVRAEVVAATRTDAVVALAYEVVVVARRDRWEVTSVSGAPTLSSSAGDHRSRSTSPPSAASSSTKADSTMPPTSAGLAPDDGATNPYLYEEEEN